MIPPEIKATSVITKTKRPLLSLRVISVCIMCACNAKIRKKICPVPIKGGTVWTSGTMFWPICKKIVNLQNTVYTITLLTSCRLSYASGNKEET